MNHSMKAAADHGTSIRIRRASPHDADALARLRYSFRIERRAPTESVDVFTTRCAEWMRPRLDADSRWIAWIAERGGHAVGQVWVQGVEKIPNPGLEPELHAYLSNFFVIAEARNTGVGTRLLRAVLDHCRSIAADSVFLWATERSAPLYLRAGFERREDLLVMDLHEGESR